MVTFKVVLGLKGGKCVQKELSEEQSTNLLGRRIGDKIPGDSLGFKDYEFELTGGSDNCGFPMRSDVQGTVRKRILTTRGNVGFQGWWTYKKGGKVYRKRFDKHIRIRKSVCGNTVHDKIIQVNLKVLKEGAPLEEKKEGEASEE